MAKKFFFVCAGLLCLAISYQLGAKNAGALVGLTAVHSVTVTARFKCRAPFALSEGRDSGS